MFVKVTLTAADHPEMEWDSYFDVPKISTAIKTIEEALETIIPSCKFIVTYLQYDKEFRRVPDLFSTVFDVEGQANVIFLGSHYRRGGSVVSLIYNLLTGLLEERRKLAGTPPCIYQGAADFGKYTVSCFDEAGEHLTWMLSVPASGLTNIAARLNLFDTATANTEWATQSLNIASGLNWKLITKFTPRIAQDGNPAEPNFFLWQTDLTTEPMPCTLNLRIFRDRSSEPKETHPPRYIFFIGGLWYELFVK